MNNLTIYNNPAFGDIRGTLDEHGEPLFVGKDVATALGYSNASKAVMTHVDDEDKCFEMMRVSDSQNGNLVKTALINESGLYSLIMSSKLPTAKQFKRWVTSEVLPAIRRTGTYTNPKAAPAVDELKQKRLQIMETNAKVRVAKQMMKLWDAAGVRAQDQALAMNSYYDGLSLPRNVFTGVTDVLLDKTAIAKHLGVLSKSGAPHAHAVGAIIGKLTLEDGECQKTPYSRNGHDGEAEQYTESVERKVKAWLEENSYPPKIAAGGKNYSVRYGT